MGGIMPNDLRLRVRPTSLLTATISALMAVAGTAKAQQLEEIIVTAERRALDLQDVPISVMSFEGEALELRGIDDLGELATIAPNLDIKGSRGTGNTSPTFQIRGISGGGGATGERGVGFYVDNVFMPRTTGPVMRVLDVERVEVLRGPQGTLFGRNSTGGAIRVFSRQPENERDAYLKLTIGDNERRDLLGAARLRRLCSGRGDELQRRSRQLVPQRRRADLAAIVCGDRVGQDQHRARLGHRLGEDRGGKDGHPRGPGDEGRAIKGHLARLALLDSDAVRGNERHRDL